MAPLRAFFVPAFGANSGSTSLLRRAIRWCGLSQKAQRRSRRTAAGNAAKSIREWYDIAPQRQSAKPTHSLTASSGCARLLAPTGCSNRSGLRPSLLPQNLPGSPLDTTRCVGLGVTGRPDPFGRRRGDMRPFPLRPMCLYKRVPRAGMLPTRVPMKGPLGSTRRDASRALSDVTDAGYRPACCPGACAPMTAPRPCEKPFERVTGAATCPA